MEVTLGGGRLGSGKNQNLELHNYYRSNHNLSTKRRTSAAPGVLYPIYTNIGLNGDRWKINIGTLVRTIPTLGPLFGSFKMQIDGFKIPIRLYQGILHNNPINIGLKMNKVYFPQMVIPTGAQAENSLTKYLGLSGNKITNRKFPAIFHLAYYDIFKNYYANKQEENAYVIKGWDVDFNMINSSGSIPDEAGNLGWTSANNNWQRTQTNNIGLRYTHELPNPATSYSYILFSNEVESVLYKNFYLVVRKYQDDDFLVQEKEITLPFTEFVETNGLVITETEYQEKLQWRIKWNMFQVIYRAFSEYSRTAGYEFLFVNNTPYQSNVELSSFPLENIDKMRNELLSSNAIGVKHSISTMPPYDISQNTNKAMAGLVLKTYQSDLFNNWVNTEWLEGENGINQISAAAITDGKLTMDTLNLSQKVYNMLNRIAVSGGTYQDWQEAVYSQKAIRHAETPIYIGGLSAEIAFDEVVATSQSNEQALGELGGRGSQNDVKGGQLEIDIDEPSIIMFILSLTPRINYTQGNKWYFTELETIDDLHKPELDGIGFQDLLQEQMHWAAVKQNTDGTLYRPSAGKIPAWINYMTDYDECFGDFAGNEGYAYMVLNRNYEIAPDDSGLIQDLTTYIDPSKYNYAFAYQGIDAQNFWVQIKFDIESRRVMSEKIIPNL